MAGFSLLACGIGNRDVCIADTAVGDAFFVAVATVVACTNGGIGFPACFARPGVLAAPVLAVIDSAGVVFGTGFIAQADSTG